MNVSAKAYLTSVEKPACYLKNPRLIAPTVFYSITEVLLLLPVTAVSAGLPGLRLRTIADDFLQL